MSMVAIKDMTLILCIVEGNFDNLTCEVCAETRLRVQNGQSIDAIRVNCCLVGTCILSQSSYLRQ